jgi:hypothetical protein
MLPTRSFVRVARSARPAQVLFVYAVLSVVESASTQAMSTSVSLIGICVTSRVCCCCPNWRICRQKERKRTSPLGPLRLQDHLLNWEHLCRESTPSRSFLVTVGRCSISISVTRAQQHPGIGPEISESVKAIYNAAKVCGLCGSQVSLN